MADSYDDNTINASNRIARFAHRRRVATSLKLVKAELGAGRRLLDYGAGSGVLVARARDAGIAAFGYEPFMDCASPHIHAAWEDAAAHGPFDLLTVFEVVEHLSDDEWLQFLARARAVLAPSGSLLISAPIEIGPALLVKDANRSWLKGKPSEHRVGDLLKAAILAKPAPRADDVKASHRGFDFRDTIRKLKAAGYAVTTRGYGPLPTGTWYGNSQVYLQARGAGP